MSTWIVDILDAEEASGVRFARAPRLVNSMENRLHTGFVLLSLAPTCLQTFERKKTSPAAVFPTNRVMFNELESRQTVI